MLRWLTAGESHGQALTAIMEGLPAGVQLTTSDIQQALARRRLGYGRGARMKFEQDAVRLLGGVRHGITQGGPVAIEIANSEWPKWVAVMGADPVDPAQLMVDAGTGDEREIARNRPLTRPRPGHADLVGMRKYGFADARPVLERASARETAARVALGQVAARFIGQAAGIQIVSHVVAIGQAQVPDGAPLPGPQHLSQVDESPVRCFDAASEQAMIAEVDAAKKDGDTLGGVVEVLAYGVPSGLGSYVQGDRRLDARLAAALMGIQAIKGVEVGDGFRTAGRRGSVAHDEMVRSDVGTDGHVGHIARLTNRAGGIEGGMSNGELVRLRAAMKPISTVPRALRTVDVTSTEPATANHQRSDVCAVPAAAIVAEAEMALVLAQALLEKCGGDSLDETRRNLQAYLEQIPELLR